MRVYLALAVVAFLAALAYSSPVPEELVLSNQPAAEALLAVDVQGHENEGEREARQFYGGYGGHRHHHHHGGGYGGYGGYRGGYGGGFRGGYGGYGGHRGGYGGYGGYYG